MCVNSNAEESELPARRRRSGDSQEKQRSALKPSCASLPSARAFHLDARNLVRQKVTDGGSHLQFESYQDLLARLKSQIRTAQVRAAVAVNRELVRLYWGIGREILQRQASEGWGSKVVKRLAKDLSAEFPEMKGLSRTNLLYMRSFAETWPEESIVQQVVGQIPWGHNVRLLDLVKQPEERLWYAQQAGWLLLS